jgi:branched-chain amino acid transport system permease protein
VLRLRGDYLAIVTLAFGEIIRIVLLNWDEPDRAGPNGIGGIPRPTFFGLPFDMSGGPAPSPAPSGWSRARSTASSSSTT